jgi:hypothetical protein
MTVLHRIVLPDLDGGVDDWFRSIRKPKMIAN